MSPIRKKELRLYALAWAMVFALVPLVMWLAGLLGRDPDICWQHLSSAWLEILPFLLLFVAHDTAAQSWLFQKKKITYALATVLLIGVFAWLCFQTGQPAQDLLPALSDDPHPTPANHHRPFRPEVMKLVIGLLIMGINLGVKAFLHAMELARLKPDSPTETPSAPSVLYFKSDYKTVTVAPGEIRYVESMGEYIKIYRSGIQEPLIVLYSMKRLLGQLPANLFLRIHRSFIVNTSLIREASATAVTLDQGETLPIGESYRAAFRKQWQSR